MDPVPDDPDETSAEFTRVPTVADLILVCRLLNEAGARYVVIGGMAVNHYGFARTTLDIDLLVDPDDSNIVKVVAALSQLPDGAAAEVAEDDVRTYTVVRINDEFTIDLLGSACGITWKDVAPNVHCDESRGVLIPFASPADLVRTKQTVREKDQIDCEYLRGHPGFQG